MIAAPFTRRCRAFAPRDPRLGKAVSATDAYVARAHLLQHGNHLATDTLRTFLTTEYNLANLRPLATLFVRFTDDVIDKRRDSDDRLGFDLLNEADVAVGAHHLASTRTDDQHAKLQPGEHDLPK